MSGLPTMNEDAVAYVRDMESALKAAPQVAITVEHVLHGGMYARTVVVPAGVIITGALIKIETILIVSGDIVVFTGEGTRRLRGEHVLPCQPNRKQAFYAHADTRLTMLIPTKAMTVSQAEQEFTDEADLLASRDGVTQNKLIRTEDGLCLA